ncbi:hypothetical protein DAI22_11g079800 [Oryza sativa Japonica Group]|nr:hypothetical protein DAI22_11g079800 [Oryza sativa Japonica Group]
MSRNLLDWWTQGTSDPKATKQKGLRTLFLLIAWENWKERNARIFTGKEATVHQMISRIQKELRWAPSMIFIWLKSGIYFSRTYVLNPQTS